MDKLILFSLLALMGCAHGAQIPESVEDAQQQGQDAVDAKKAEGQAKLDDTKAQGMNQVGGMASNASMSKAIAAAVLDRMPLIADQEALMYANMVGQYMAQELVPSLKCHTDGTGATEVRVAIVKSSTPSSFSLPGGLIFVTTAEMQKMTTEDELAGVIANEIVFSVCEKGVPGDLAQQAATGWSDYVTSLPTKAMSPADQAFADKYALVTLYRRGYDVTPYVSFVSKNETSGRHMNGAERASVLQKSVAATPAITPTAAARTARFNSAKSASL